MKFNPSTLSAPQRLTATLAAAIVGGATVLAWQVDFGNAFRPNQTAGTLRTATLDARALPGFRLPPIDPQFKETTERPLFTPTRRPAPPGNATPQQAMRKGQYKLAGTVVNGEVSVAFLLESSTNKTVRVALGTEVGGMKLASVSPTSVVLRLGDETEELSLRSSVSPKAPPQAVAAVAPPGGAAPPGGFPQPGGNVLMPGVAFGAAPGMPGGPPLPAGIPGIPAATSGGFPLNSPIPGAGQVAGVPPNVDPNAAPAAQPLDPNSPAARRRRFQNLPQ